MSNKLVRKTCLAVWAASAVVCASAEVTTVAENGLVKRSFDVSSGSFRDCSYWSRTGLNHFVPKSTREFSFSVNGRTYSGADNWKDFRVEKVALANGGDERRVSFAEPSGAFRVTLAYTTYPNLELVRKTLAVENLGDADLRLEAVCVEDFQTTIPVTHAQTFRHYGRYRAEGPYVGDWNDPLVVIHDLRKRNGLAIGNEEIGVLKRTGVFEGGSGVRAGVTHPGQAYAFRRWLKKGQSWQSAAVFTAGYEAELGPQRVMDTTVADYVRKYMGARVTSLRKKPMFVYNTWRPFTYGIDEKLICELADAAAECGVEEFVIDDGWHVNAGARSGTCGDWEIDRRKFPNGLKPVFDHIRAKGMKPGLWLSLARVHVASQVCRRHPDWFVKRADGKMMDLHTGTERSYVTACMGTDWKDYMRDTILRYVRDYGLAYVKLDLAIVTSAYIYDDAQSGCDAKDHPHHRDREESFGVIYARCMELFDELHAAAPDLFIDCTFETAGKLQLMDYGIAKHAEGNWLSNIGGEDLTGPMRMRDYAWGRCPALPATSLVIGNLFMDGPMRLSSYKSLTGSLPIMLGDPRKLSKAERAEFRAWSGWMKGLEERHGVMSFRQDLAGFGEPTAGCWDGFARINTETKSGGLVGVFRTDSAEPSRLVTVRDLEPSARYAVLRAPDGAPVAEMTGAELAEKGFAVTLAEKTDSALLEIVRLSSDR